MDISPWSEWSLCQVENPVICKMPQKALITHHFGQHH